MMLTSCGAKQVFVWTASDVFGLAILGLVVIGIIIYIIVSFFQHLIWKHNQKKKYAKFKQTTRN